jgi:hypothetical protein
MNMVNAVDRLNGILCPGNAMNAFAFESRLEAQVA